MALRMLLRVVSVMYGIFGLLGILQVAVLIVFTRHLGTTGKIEADTPIYTLILALMWLFNAIGGLLIMYAFWRLKRWGPHIIATFNGMYIAALFVGFVWPSS